MTKTKEKEMKCPMCESGNLVHEYKEEIDTHTYTCDECMFMGFELIDQNFTEDDIIKGEITMRKLELLNNGNMHDTLTGYIYRENNDGVWELHPKYQVVITNGTDEYVEYEGNNLEEAFATRNVYGGEIRANFTDTGHEVIATGHEVIA